MRDHVDEILNQWHAEKPHLDVSPMAVIGRLSRAADSVNVRLAKTFARHGLDAPTFDVLATLLRSGKPYRITPAALAKDAMITTSAVAQRLNKLEGLGFVRRHANPDDARSTLIALTSAGKALVERVLPDHLAGEREITDALTAREQAQFIALLRRIDDAARIASLPPAAT